MEGEFLKTEEKPGLDSVAEPAIAASQDSEGGKDLFDYYQRPEYYRYLEDIRKKLFNLVVAFVVFFLAGFFLTAPILKRLVSWFQVKDVSIVTNSPFQFLDLAVNTGLIIASLAVAPLLV